MTFKSIITSQIASFCLTIALLFSYSSIGVAQSIPQAVGPIPTENQLKWQEMEYYAFVHFSTNTFTNQEWGFGDDDPKIFNPTQLDCRQWARVCKEAGMKGVIITAKHHSGFCLWPSKYTEYSVKNSPWKNGKGDIVGDLAKACKEYGLKLGIYLSPWDRNFADYGKPEYITYFRNQLRELMTQYGDIFEIWFDGANGGDGYYGGTRGTRKIDRTTYYDWSNTYKLIRELQPKIVIWNDGGDRADLRWVGTEEGYVGEKNWSLLNAKGDVPEDMLRHGVENGEVWVPGEVNTSTRPGWFYHEYEDSRVKTLPDLMNTYHHSIGRNGTLLLNFPIDKRGLIHENDEKAVKALAKAVKEAYSVNLAQNKKATVTNTRENALMFNASKALDGDKNTYWATDEGITNAAITIDLGKPTVFNRFMAQEYIRLGQRVKSFKIEALIDGNWKEIAQQTTIGYKRILVFPTVKASKVRFTILDTKACPLISNIGIYNAPQILTAPSITRNQAGAINIKADDPESLVYYTIDGSTPTTKSAKYTGAIQINGKATVKAIAVEASTKKSSEIAEEKFDIVKKDWKIVGISDEKAYKVIDGNSHTAWYQAKTQVLPADLIIDLGKEVTLTGFKYLPWQSTDGVISKYQFSVSADGNNWTIVNEGEFSNIKNNPLLQVKTFPPSKGKFIKFTALKNTKNDNWAGYAELDVITK